MAQTLLTYDLLKETVTAKMIIYKYSKIIILSPDEDTDFFYRVDY